MIETYPNDNKINIIVNLAKNIILNCNSVEEILTRFNKDIIPHINIFFPICEFGTFKEYTFYTHGFINHEKCSRRCIKDCVIEY
jgi:hypothetical protein